MTAVLRWFEQWLGVKPAEPGQGTAWHVTTAWPGPAWLTLLLGVATIAFVIWLYRCDASHLPHGRRRLLTTLRLLTWSCLVAMLSQAILNIERTGLPFLILLVDNSASMATRDQYASKETRALAEKIAGSPTPTGSPGNAPSRLELAQKLLCRDQASLLRTLFSSHKVRAYGVAENPVLLGRGDYLQVDDVTVLQQAIEGLEATGELSRLGDAIRKVISDLRGLPPTAIVLFSDGINTDGEKLSAAARFARQKGVPLYVVALGNPQPARDVELHDVLVDDVAFVDDPVTFSCKITAQGLAGTKARLVLREKSLSEPIAATDVELGADGRAQKVELTFTPRKVGEFDYVLEAELPPAASEAQREINTQNNREVRHISVRKERVRVLLVDHSPRWEFRELKGVLEREKTIQLRVVLQDADPEYAQEDEFALPHFPVKKEELFDYDVILFGDVYLSYLSSTAQENLKEFVSAKGGGVVFIAGPLQNPVAYHGSLIDPLFPVELSTATRPDPQAVLSDSFRLELTPEGRKGAAFFRLADSEAESQQVWNRLPGLIWFAETPEVRTGGIVLATHPIKSAKQGKLPLLVMRRYGAGKVLYQGTDETWRWRFRTGDQYFGRYWVQLIRYLSRSKLLGRDRGAELTVDRRSYRAGDTVELRVRFLEDRLAPTARDGVVVVVEREGAPQKKLTLTRLAESPTIFEGELPQVSEGNYHTWIATPAFDEAPPSQDFRVESPARETRILRTDVNELKRAAELTDGRFYTLDDVARLSHEIPTGLPVPLDAEEPIRLWNHWLLLTLFVLALCTEWTLRKRWQLA